MEALIILRTTPHNNHWLSRGANFGIANDGIFSLSIASRLILPFLVIDTRHVHSFAYQHAEANNENAVFGSDTMCWNEESIWSACNVGNSHNIIWLPLANDVNGIMNLQMHQQIDAQILSAFRVHFIYFTDVKENIPIFGYQCFSRCYILSVCFRVSYAYSHA